jgi:hypothetical protein
MSTAPGGGVDEGVGLIETGTLILMEDGEGGGNEGGSSRSLVAKSRTRIGATGAGSGGRVSESGVLGGVEARDDVGRTWRNLDA